MTNTNGMRLKFRVIKEDDVNKYLSDKERFMLNHLQSVIALGRESDGKPTTNEYLVVNTDESYAGDVIKLLKKNGDWGEPDEVPTVEEFINQQIAYYLDEEKINVTPEQKEFIEQEMVNRIIGRIGISSWHFDAEVFRMDMLQLTSEVTDNKHMLKEE